jgi:hypothetical protein
MLAAEATVEVNATARVAPRSDLYIGLISQNVSGPALASPLNVTGSAADYITNW